MDGLYFYSFVILVVQIWTFFKLKKLNQGMEAQSITVKTILEKINLLYSNLAERNEPEKKFTIKPEKPVQASSVVFDNYSTIHQEEPVVNKNIPEAPLEIKPIAEEIKKEPERVLENTNTLKTEPEKENLFFNKIELNPSEETDSNKILTKIKNWIIYGEESLSPNKSKEFAIATTWLLRFGVLALVYGVGYILVWSIENEVLGPAGRVFLSCLFAISLMFSGLRLINGKYHLIGQGLLSTGIVLLYFSVYASGHFYNFIPTSLEFLLMVVITIGVAFLSVKIDSLLVAIMSVTGGFFTPIFVSSNTGNVILLYSYMLMLNIGILFIAHHKNWRLLNYIGWFFTYILFMATEDSFKKEEFKNVYPFLCSFFLIHSVLVYYYNILKKNLSSNFEIGYLILNSLLFFALSYSILSDEFKNTYSVAILTTILATYYIFHSYSFFNQQVKDRKLSIAVISLACFYTAATLPLAFEKQTLTISWALFSALIIFVGRRVSSQFLVTVSYLSYIVLVVRLLGYEFEQNYSHEIVFNSDGYWSALAKRILTFGSSIGSFFIAYIAEKKQYEESVLSGENDIRLPIPKNIPQEVFFWIIMAVVLFVFNMEIAQSVTGYSLRRMLILLIWMSVGLAFIKRFANTDKPYPALYIAGLVIFSIVFFNYLYHFLEYWSQGIVGEEYTFENFVYRLLSIGIILYGFYGGATSLLGKNTKVKSTLFSILGITLLFLFLSIETKSFFLTFFPYLAKGAVSILWSAMAIGFILYGLKKESGVFRYSGLVLFLIVLFKVFFVDLAQMEMIVKIAAFLVLGGLLIAGSFVYIKYSRE